MPKVIMQDWLIEIRLCAYLEKRFMIIQLELDKLPGQN